MNTANSNTWIIAGAVVFAGLLIAGGIFFGDQDSTTATNGDGVIAAAEAAGVNSDEFQSCLESTDFRSDVEEDVNNAAQAGGGGTPFNVLVAADPISQATQDEITGLIESIEVSEDGRRLSISGAMPYAPMTQIIDLILEDPESDDADAATSDDIAINPVDEDDHVRGDIEAEIVLVEYSDFLCPFCAQFHETMKQIVDTYDDDQFAWVYRQFPIPQLHPEAPRYSQASECIADIEGNDAFWDFADAVFEAQN